VIEPPAWAVVIEWAETGSTVSVEGARGAEHESRSEGDRCQAQQAPVFDPTDDAFLGSAETMAFSLSRTNSFLDRGSGAGSSLTWVRVLVVTNFVPDAAAPQRGRWVRDQVEAMRELGIEVEVFSFPPGSRRYMPATRQLRKLLRRERFDLVHAHYGLPGWCAQLAGARPLIVSFHGTDVRHWLVGALSRRLAWRVDLVAAVSRALYSPEDGRPGLPPVPGSAVLPCGPDLGRFGPTPRAEARRRLDLDPDRPFLFFPASPSRAEKRHDRAAELARACDAQLLGGGSIDPDQMPLWINAANAVLVTSDYEGFGLAALEALACDVPVLSTPVGIAPYALRGVDGALCAPFDLDLWAAVVKPHLEAPDPRVKGAGRVASLSAVRMAERTIVAYRDVLGGA
jgi:glycosyltransferase involved in cell wall biosynthesis